jgi:hypothetical protein
VGKYGVYGGINLGGCLDGLGCDGHVKKTGTFLVFDRKLAGGFVVLTNVFTS